MFLREMNVGKLTKFIAFAMLSVCKAIKRDWQTPGLDTISAFYEKHCSELSKTSQTGSHWFEMLLCKAMTAALAWS